MVAHTNSPSTYQVKTEVPDQSDCPRFSFADVIEHLKNYSGRGKRYLILILQVAKGIMLDQIYEIPVTQKYLCGKYLNYQILVQGIFILLACLSYFSIVVTKHYDQRNL